MSCFRAALLSTLTLCVFATGNALAQVPPPPGAPDRPFDEQVTPPGGFKPAPRAINIMKGPAAIEALDAFAAGFLPTFEVQGPPGTVLSIKSIENVSFPGNVPAAALFELVDAPASTKGGSGGITGAGGSTGGSGSGTPTITGPANQIPTDLTLARDSNISTIVTVRKRVRYKGVPTSAVQDTAGFLRNVDLELQAAAQGTTTRTRKVTVLLGRDNGPPRIVFAGGNANESREFPPFGGSAENNNGWNVVRTSMEILIDAEDFTVPTTPLDEAFRAMYRVIVEYEDGAKFSRSYTGLGRPANSPPSISRLKVIVPNIGRGGFKVALANPFGSAVDIRNFTFPGNTFTTHPVASCLITFVGVDVPAYATTENSFWPPTSFQPEALPSSKSCGKFYGEWESVKVDGTSAGLGVGSGKLTRTPSKGSLAHNGNMPAFSCNGATIDLSVRINWTAKLKIYDGECSNERIQ